MVLSISNDYLSNFHVALEQKCALVTAEPVLFSKHTTGFIHEEMLKGAGIGVERGRLDA
jgi:hypothetical protein